MKKFTYSKPDKKAIYAAAEFYCKTRGYDVSALSELEFMPGWPSSGFGIASKVKPNGLMNDIETQATPILCVILQPSGDYVVKEVEENSFAYFHKQSGKTV